MYAVFALVATALTSLLPILNKRLLQHSGLYWALNSES